MLGARTQVLMCPLLKSATCNYSQGKRKIKERGDIFIYKPNRGTSKVPDIASGNQ